MVVKLASVSPKIAPKSLFGIGLLERTLDLLTGALEYSNAYRPVKGCGLEPTGSPRRLSAGRDAEPNSIFKFVESIQ
jgi:hypothetical protein